MKQIRTSAALLAASLLAVPVAFAADGFVTSSKPYVEPIGSAYQLKPILSVGDQVPETSDSSRRYQMVGIPDGLGAHRTSDGTITLFMNHEVGRLVKSQPVIGGPTYRGAFISKYILSDDGSVLSGERAYDSIFDVEKNALLPAPETTNATPGFTRFCSGSLAGQAEGFDRPIYFCGEESSGADTYDGKGGLAVAVMDNVAYTLPKLGHFPWENVVPRSFQGNEVVIMCMEDGPTTPDSQLYMYVGKKEHRKGADVLNRNGLNNGQLYAFRSKDAARKNETTFQEGSIAGEWVAIPNAETLNDAQLEVAADAAGAFGFIRTEDGAWSKNSRKDYYFVTTGGNKAAGNELGRAYHLELNPGNPLKDAKLTVIYNADKVIAAGGDIAISPDNIDASSDYLMICEDGTTQSRAVMAAKGRDGSVWRLDLNTPAPLTGFKAERVAELNPPGRDGKPVGLGIWETSGIIDGTALFGEDTWIYDVQAHPPTAAPNPATQAEDGQLLIMVPSVQ